MKKGTKLKFDELNVLDSYYEPMQIGKDGKQRRRELAELLTDAFLFFFATFEVHKEHQSVLTKQLYVQLLADKISEALTNVTGIDSYMSSHIRELSKEVVDTTFKRASDSRETESKGPQNLSSVRTIPGPSAPSLNNNTGGLPPGGEEIREEGYWLSYKRAEDIAKSEANTFLNYTDFVEAKAEGKTMKTWLTMLDDKVRNTHEEVEGRTIGIDESFVVGNSLMKFPHDLSESPDPHEVIGCRCAVEYK